MASNTRIVAARLHTVLAWFGTIAVILLVGSCLGTRPRSVGDDAPTP